MDWKQYRKNWRREWLGSIEEFSNIRAQWKLWLDQTHDNPHHSYVEYMCSYFNDLDLEEGYEGHVAEGRLLAEEAKAISEFHQLADSYEAPDSDNHDHRKILNDPAWWRVVQAADAAKANLLKTVRDDCERHILQGTKIPSE